MSALLYIAHQTKAAAMRGLIASIAAVALAGCASGGVSPTTPASSARAAAPPAAQPPASAAAPETNPAGDIPDNQAYISYVAPDATFNVAVPEGWARTNRDQVTIFTDKLNSVRIESQVRPTAPDAGSVQATELPALRSSVPGFRGGTVSTVQRKAGTAVLVRYEAISPPEPVTGRSITDAVERYEFWRSGQQITLTLSGPKDADNVDPWRLVTDSLRWRR